MENKMRSILGVGLMLLCAACLCGGQFIWKYSQSPIALLSGFMIYGFGALAMLCAYSFGNLSTLQPINSVSYAISAVLGSLVFNEVITLSTVLGIGLIIMGVVFLAQGDKVND